MKSIDDLIAYENEHTGLDFKSELYRKEKHEDFLKDVLSMANADYAEDRFIIIGVAFENGEKEVRGIEAELPDAAIYQQLLHDNVEPGIDLRFFKHVYEEKTFVVFQLSNCTDQPYMMKKQFGKLNKGVIWTRKGSTQMLAGRSDFDRMNQKRVKHEDPFKGKLKLIPSVVNTEDGKLYRAKKLPYPIDMHSYIIAGTIAEFIAQLHDWQIIHLLRIYRCNSVIDVIEKNQCGDDKLYLWEDNSSRLNFKFFNDGDEYLYDVTLEISFQKQEGLFVNTEETKTLDDQIKDQFATPELHAATLQQTDNKWIIRKFIGDIKHGLPEVVFETELRVFINENYKANTVEGLVKVYSKNLKKPVLLTFSLDVSSEVKLIIDD